MSEERLDPIYYIAQGATKKQIDDLVRKYNIPGSTETDTDRYEALLKIEKAPGGKKDVWSIHPDLKDLRDANVSNVDLKSSSFVFYSPDELAQLKATLVKLSKSELIAKRTELKNMLASGRMESQSAVDNLNQQLSLVDGLIADIEASTNNVIAKPPVQAMVASHDQLTKILMYGMGVVITVLIVKGLMK